MGYSAEPYPYPAFARPISNWAGWKVLQAENAHTISRHLDKLPIGVVMDGDTRDGPVALVKDSTAERAAPDPFVRAFSCDSHLDNALDRESARPGRIRPRAGTDASRPRALGLAPR